MYATTTSILPHAPGKGNDPTIKFANAFLKKVSKDKIEEHSAVHGKRARRSIIRMYRSMVPTNRKYEQAKRNVKKLKKNKKTSRTRV